VQEARKKKARRLKQAKDEATSEIERFRADRERNFREDTIKDSIERETQGKLEMMNKSVITSKDIVIKDLLSRVVCEVQPKLHTNLRLA
ncbi:V-type proton ATPase subunit G, partial [Golovinomyces cichoracearum]